MKYLWPILFVLVGFKSEPTHQFNAGECALFADQPGKLDKTMVVRVEGLKDGRYLYRWWTFQGEWSVELGKVVAEQKMFERLFILVDCPDSFI